MGWKNNLNHEFRDKIKDLLDDARPLHKEAY